MNCQHGGETGGAWCGSFWSVAISETCALRGWSCVGWSCHQARFHALCCSVSSRREIEMPEIYVHAVKGRTLDQKRALVKDITDAVVKNFSVPVEAVTVEIVEAEPTAKAKGGVLFSEMRR
jgi:4-oxalocrotonate tautomerase